MVDVGTIFESGGLPSGDFIPYTSYLNKDIILTKNGDLVMVFKIHGIISNQGEDLVNIRESLRNMLSEIYTDHTITLYFTTARKKQNLVPFGKYENYFSKTIENAWNEQNEWNNQFMNELYLSVVVSLDINDKLFNPSYFFSTFTTLTLNILYKNKIDFARKVLSGIKKAIINSLATHDIKILTLSMEDDNVLYAEHLRFFSLIMNLEKFDFPVSYDEISDVLRQKKINYGADFVSMEDGKGNKKYASVLTQKMFQNLSLSQVDTILQLPIQLVITESETLVKNKYVEGLLEDQKKMLEYSEDKDLHYFVDAENFSFNERKDINYSVGQTTFMIINDTREGLVNDLKLIYKKLGQIGLVLIKETVYLPTIFWSQLPGNMRYLKRLFISPNNKIGNFFSLFSFPIGKLKFNYWGNAITVIPTAIKTLYFFNFHTKEVANAFIHGGYETGKTTILNFLVSQALKLSQRLFYIDVKRNSEIFVNAIGGKYYRISPNLSDEEMFKINPFLLDSTPENLDFLSRLIIKMIDWQDDNLIEMGHDTSKQKEQYAKIDDIVLKIMDLHDKSFKNAIECFNTSETSIIYQKLRTWIDDPKFSFIFSDTNTSMDDNIIGISLRTILPDKNAVLPVFMYLLRAMDNFANNEPTLFAIDDCWSLIDDIDTIEIFTSLLDELPKKNVATIISINTLPETEQFTINDEFEGYFSTEIFLSNPNVTAYQRQVLNITDEEKKVLSLMKIEERNFLLKNLNNIVIAQINLDKFKNYRKILSNDNISLNAYKKAIDTVKTNSPDVWIPVFIKILDDYDKSLAMKKLRIANMNQQKWEKSKGKGESGILGG
ncbi:MAG: hypothetical protein LBC92_01130 [Rickettsiales bacterium]|jgi:type IV secretion system protein VirB4|nr:hypothetical protein [Rickettsiales bacterium]